MKYKINEIFNSIQGEGYYSGKGAVFIRFAGCNLNCSFCDTNFKAQYELTKEGFHTKIKKYKSKHLVITGGEPTLQWDSELYDFFKELGYYIQIETNGTTNKVFADWITCSPKENFILSTGDELKLIYNGQQNIKKYLLLHFNHFILQPESENKKYTREILKIIQKEPRWRIGLQLHKMLNVQ